MKYCIVNFEDYEVVSKLMELGYYCYDVIKSDNVSRPISRHSDVLYQKISNDEIMISSCQKANLPLLNRLGYSVSICNDLKPGYKTESLLNYIINDSYIISNPRTAYCNYSELRTINVKQGYTKCSTICINSKAYITEDEGIYKKLTDENLDCLIIEKGNVRLDGYDYGFIGGASVMLNNNELLFFGDIDNIRTKKEITEFLTKHNVKPIFIENKKLNDIGSALILSKI